LILGLPWKKKQVQDIDKALRIGRDFNLSPSSLVMQGTSRMEASRFEHPGVDYGGGLEQFQTWDRSAIRFPDRRPE
jgi:hypothetical protein